jgi:hypothetical protein
MTANDYSIEKYVSEYLKPLEEKGTIYRIRIYPNLNRIRFQLYELIKGLPIKAEINKKDNSNTIKFTLFFSAISYQVSYDELKNILYFITDAKERLKGEMKWVKQYDEKSNRVVLEEGNEYITKYLKPLKEKGLIKDVHEDCERDIWFTLVENINGKEISAHLKPGKNEDCVFFYPTTGFCKYRPLYMAGLLNPKNDPHYTETIEQYILQGIKYIKEQFIK